MKTRESFKDASDKAWNGLIQGATEIYTTFGIFTLGDLFIISRYKERYRNKIGLILERKNKSFIVPGYEIDNDNSFNLKHPQLNTYPSITDLRTQKAEWN